MPDVLRVRRDRDGRDHLVQGDFDRLGARADVHLARRAVQVSGLQVPVLAFALVGCQLDYFAVRAMEGLVHIEHSLDKVIAGGHLAQRRDRVSRGCIGEGLR